MLSISDFVVDVWNVVTIGPSATIRDSMEIDGALGSCTCKTSNSPSTIHCRNPRYAWGEKVTRDTDPLYGIASAGPAETT